MTHLITGATGALGAALLSTFRTRGVDQPLALGARDPSRLAAEGMPVRRVDYDDAASMREAFTGVSTLLLISSNAANEVRRRQHAAAIDIAAQVGVGRILYTSFVGADRPGTNELLAAHHDAEQRLRASGVPWVALRNGAYLDALPGFLGPFRDLGVVAHPAGTAAVAWISRADIAAFTLDVLLDESVRNTAIEVVPPKTRSLPSIVDAVAEHTGVAIAYAQPSEDDYRAMLVEAGLNESTAQIFAQVCRAMREGQLDVASDGFESRLGRSPESVASYIERTL